MSTPRVNGVRRQLGTSWDTVWTSIKPMLAAAAADESRFENVSILGVDEHVWHHVSTKPVEHGGRGPKELTGMVDLTRDEHGQGRRRGCWTWFPAAPGRPTRTGCTSAARPSGPGSRSPRWTRSTGTRTRSMTSCRTPARCWTRSTSSSSPRRSWTTSGAGCSRTPPATGAARTTRCTGSGTSSALAKSISPTGNAPASRRVHRPGGTPRGRARLAVRPTGLLGLPPGHPRRRPRGRKPFPRTGPACPTVRSAGRGAAAPAVSATGRGPSRTPRVLPGI